MSLTQSVLEIWRKKGQILEGIKNNIFKKDDVEAIKKHRLAICRSNACGSYDRDGSSPKAFVPGSESCAECGCKLSWKAAALSDVCPLSFWPAIMTESEEEALKLKLGITDGEETAG